MLAHSYTGIEATPVGSEGDGCGAANGYLMHARYALSEHDGCIAEARHRAVAFLTKAQVDRHLPVPPRARDLTQLVVSELVTNARKYAPGPVLLELCINARAVDVVVWDSDPTVPVARAADPDRIGQHGLEVVRAVTEALFIEQELVGKRITARIALSGGPGGHATSTHPS
ncbi:anti-sigma regulatory factor (Ser/Thr protein kinase) [Streptomyces sp. SLBN-8D4]